MCCVYQPLFVPGVRVAEEEDGRRRRAVPKHDAALASFTLNWPGDGAGDELHPAWPSVGGGGELHPNVT